MAKFNLDNYELVEDRLKKFWKDNPNGRINTDVVSSSDDGTMVIVKAELYLDKDDPNPVSSGLAQETKGLGGFANKEAWLENCESSAIGRALANWKYQGNKKPRPTQEEMKKVVEVESVPVVKPSKEEQKKMEDVVNEMVAEPKEPTRVSDASPTYDSELELKDIIFDLCGQEAAFARKAWDFTLTKVNLKKGFPKEFFDYTDDNEKTFIEEASKFIDKHRAEFKNRKANSQVINEVIEVFDGDVEVKEIEGEEDMSDVPSGKWEGEPPSDKQVGILEEKIKDAIDAGKDELAAKAKAFLNSGEATKKNIFDWINTDGDWSLKDGS